MESDSSRTVGGQACDKRHRAPESREQTVRRFTLRALAVPEVIELTVEYAIDGALKLHERNSSDKQDE